MKAENRPSYDQNRNRLSDLIPLDTPFTIFIEPTRYCNFKCYYCLHSTKEKKESFFEENNYPIKSMNMDLFLKLLDDLKKFPKKIKRIVFSGLGEPLMNQKLPEMIALVKAELDVERVDILTNAALLTPSYSKRLLDAGVSRIQISLQGLDANTYYKTAGVRLDFDKFLNNIKFLYANKQKTTIFIKIIDALLDGPEDEQKFHNLFGDYCDQIYIEHLIKLQQQMGDHKGKVDNRKNLNNELVDYWDVCPVIFYMINVDVDGNVFPCPVSGLPNSLIMGNVKNEELTNIWNGRQRNSFLKAHLKKNRNKIFYCKTCEACGCIQNENEYLDDCANEILEKI